ncbi:amidohydrolase [Symbiobacterium thermophilum]|uniref:Putative amidohydrolase n=1 Tax=Symbiobacterium thermophilum (strain DSM 24528 / JCM 14929 / IAM 14863 / T) TaxID=292459 RepID=Q67N46_SYMTH|nr:amidohydrolase [Symbiobacterium thermophilum]BAD40897.1 putative amidohydrolase [Symbiobacterium thermophilum IAM 14863]
MTKLAITGATVYPISRPPMAGATLLVGDGKILAVGLVEIPSDAEVVDARGLHLLPGFVDPHTHVGLWGEGDGPPAYDGNEWTSPTTAQVRALDAINPFHVSFADARSAGVTTVQTLPGSGNPIGGEMVVIKTRGRTADEMVLRRPSGLKGALGENPKRLHGQNHKRTPATRMGVAAVIRQFLTRARAYDPEKGRDLGLELARKVLDREIPLRLHAHRADDILTAIRIAREFSIDLSIEHCTEGWMVVDALAEAGYPVTLGPMLGGRSKVETANLTFRNPGILEKAGVHVSLMTDHPFVPIAHHRIQGALAVREGMSEAGALRAMTLSPAEMLGVADRVGSLEPGKDADFVLWSDHPFRARARVLATYIEGQRVYEAKSLS